MSKVRNSEFQSRRKPLVYENDYELHMQYETYKSNTKNLDLRKLFSFFIFLLYVPFPPVCHNTISVEVLLPFTSTPEEISDSMFFF